MQNFNHFIQQQDVFIAFLDGNENKTLQQFYQNIASALQFPSYFTKNLDSFDEIMNDLSWIEPENIILIIANASQLLSEEDEEIKPIVVDIIQQSEENQTGISVYLR
ncbi:MAG: barstar family protein [Sphingobacteriales bacterium]|jgi:RNAse (barnase) inhibitor barstar|nr:MAG: barstar family protein [Sphingobacteriales bacterium]